MVLNSQVSLRRETSIWWGCLKDFQVLPMKIWCKMGTKASSPIHSWCKSGVLFEKRMCMLRYGLMFHLIADFAVWLSRRRFWVWFPLICTCISACSTCTCIGFYREYAQVPGRSVFTCVCAWWDSLQLLCMTLRKEWLYRGRWDSFQVSVAANYCLVGGASVWHLYLFFAGSEKTATSILWT